MDFLTFTSKEMCCMKPFSHLHNAQSKGISGRWSSVKLGSGKPDGRVWSHHSVKIGRLF